MKPTVSLLLQRQDNPDISQRNLELARETINIAGGRGQGAGGSLETLEFQWFYLLFMS